MIKNLRPAIPEDIKREVRQRCGFGCVLCGTPIYEYEHMLEWSKLKKHIADKMTLLCPRHHSEKTKGLLPISKVRQANASPFNINAQYSSKYPLYYEGSSPTINIGGNCFQYSDLPDNYIFSAICIDKLSIIGFKIIQGNIFLHFNMFNEINQPVIRVEDNEVTYNTGNWDVEWVSSTLTIRSAKRHILLKIRFEPPDTVKILRARLLYNGIELLVKDDYLFCVNNASFFGSIATKNIPIGIAIGSIPDGVAAGIVMQNVNRDNVDKKASMKFLQKSLRENKNAV